MVSRTSVSGIVHHFRFLEQDSQRQLLNHFEGSHHLSTRILEFSLKQVSLQHFIGHSTSHYLRLHHLLELIWWKMCAFGGCSRGYSPIPGKYLTQAIVRSSLAISVKRKSFDLAKTAPWLGCLVRDYTTKYQATGQSSSASVAHR